jgi:cell division protein FtsN
MTPAIDAVLARRGASAQRGGFALGLVVGLLIGLALALGVALYMTKAPVPFVDKVPLRTGETEAQEAARNKDWNPNAPLASKVPRPTPPGAERDVDAPAAEGTAPTGGVPTGVPAAAPARDPAAILAGAPTAPLAGSTAKPGAGATPQAGAPVAAPGAVTTTTGAAGPAPAGKAAPSATPGAAGSSVAAEGFVYFVQAGAFVQIEDAQAQRAKLAMVGQEARVFAREQAGRTVHRVRVGPFDSTAEAEAAREKLAKAGFEATLVRMDKTSAASQ